MVARRLLIVMIVLLAISTLAAALIPPPPRRATPTGTTQTIRHGPGGPLPAPPAHGGLVHASLRSAGPDRRPVRAALDDELILVVRSARADQVEIAGYGNIEAVSPDAPARFDLLLDTSGAFPIRLVAAKRRLGTLYVSSSSGTKRRSKRRPSR